jgi:proteasome lid subunit RPN8/RPN11
MRVLKTLALLITSSLRDQINQAGIAAYPLECCGLMLGHLLTTSEDHARYGDNRQAIEIVAADNRWDSSVQALTEPAEAISVNGETVLDRHRRYWIDPEMILKVQRQARDRNLDIIGVYHSHPNHPAMPSECDRRLAWPVYSYVIISVQAKGGVDFRSWRLNEHHRFQAEAVKIVDKIRT